MSEQATVTAAEIARLAGVGRAAVSNWRKRYADFPQPVGGPPNSPTFDLAEVESWLRGQGKLRSVRPEDRVWHELEALRDVALPNAVVLIGVFLQYLAERGVGQPTAGQSTAGQPTAGRPTAGRSAALRLDPVRLSTQLRRRLDELPAGPALAEPFTPRQMSLLKEIADTAARRGAAATFDYFLGRYRDAVSRREFVTPPELADLMVSLASVPAEPTSVLDPACGTGTLLATVVRRLPGCEVRGQEFNPQSAALALVRLRLAGANVEVAYGDTMLADAYPDLAADAALCHPPFGARDWGHDELTYDPRWGEYGMPPRGEPELAWVAHCLARVRSGGTVVVMMPPTAASRASGRRIRAQLLRRGALRAVIALPTGALSYTAVPVQLWVLRRPSDDEPTPSHLLLVDTVGDAERSRSVDWDRIGTVVLDAWRQFLKHPESVDEPGVAGTVPLIDILDEEVDLTPSRRLVPVASGATGPRFAEVVGELSELLREIPGLVPGVEVADAAEGWPTYTVAELAKLGALTLHSGGTRPADGSGGVPVLTARDLITGSGPSETTADDESAVHIAPGDVVVPIAAREIVPTVMTEGGAVLGAHLYLVRPDPEVFDPWFLAGFLRTHENVRLSSSPGSMNRIDIRRARVPRPPLAEQQRYAEVFRRLATLERSLGRAAELGRDLGRIAAEGLAAGVLRPAG